MAYTPARTDLEQPIDVPLSDGHSPSSAFAQPVVSAELPRAGSHAATLDVSVVIPVFNEEETLPLLHRQLLAVLANLGRSYEVIFVDDGSTDQSYPRILELADDNSQIRVVRFRRNFGQTAAISAGFTAASGAVIITMDGDLQNDPADIPTLLDHIDEGWDIASGWRAERKDHFLTRTLPSRAANSMISYISGLYLHDHGCTLKAYRADLAKRIQLYGEMHRFIPAAATALGARVIEVPVRHHPRRYGTSKYGLSRILKVFLDLLLLKFLLSYASRPMRVFGLVGISAFALGALVLGYLSIERLVFEQSIAGRPLMMMSMLLVIFGVQLISMGLLGELLVRIYHETQHKPTYTVRDALGWTSPSAPENAQPAATQSHVVSNTQEAFAEANSD